MNKFHCCLFLVCIIGCAPVNLRYGGKVVYSDKLKIGSRAKQTCPSISGGIKTRVSVCTMEGWSKSPLECIGK